jgi:hypothetical protein
MLPAPRKKSPTMVANFLTYSCDWKGDAGNGLAVQLPANGVCSIN